MIELHSIRKLKISFSIRSKFIWYRGWKWRKIDQGVVKGRPSFFYLPRSGQNINCVYIRTIVHKSIVIHKIIFNLSSWFILQKNIYGNLRFCTKQHKIRSFTLFLQYHFQFHVRSEKKVMNEYYYSLAKDFSFDIEYYVIFTFNLIFYFLWHYILLWSWIKSCRHVHIWHGVTRQYV